MQQMLENVKVLDFSVTVAGSQAAGMLADFGADVIKIEKPDGGDPCRELSPFMKGVSLMHCFYNRGKQSVTLDLNNEKHREIVRKMAAEADVILESFQPGAMKAWGLDYAAVAGINPRVIYCSVTPFGQNGPYAQKQGNDLICQALSGIMSITGDPNSVPLKHGTPVSDLAGAENAYALIVGALAERLNSGKGQYIDVATMRMCIVLNSAIDQVNFNSYRNREGNHHPTLSPFGLFMGNGGGVIITALNAKLWNSLCNAIGKPELEEDPRFSTLASRVENRQLVAGVIEDWLKTFDNLQDAIDLIDKAGIPCCQVYTAKDVVTDPHYTSPEVGWFTYVEAPESLKKQGVQKLFTHNTNAKFYQNPGEVKQAPDLGEHNIQVLKRYGMNEEEIKQLLH